MELFPAVDILKGRCVRLERGDPARSTVYYDDPLEAARRWEREGARALHVVDLNAAMEDGDNVALITRLLAATKAPVQVGGGLRDRAAVERVLAAGAARAVVSTAAVAESGFLSAIARAFPGRVSLALDARAGMLYIRGWKTAAMVRALDFLRSLGELPLASVIYTDISRDGMLSGANCRAAQELARESLWPVVASGGIARLEQLRRLRAAGLHGAILGRALYEGQLTLAEALAAAEGRAKGERRKAK